MSDLKGKLTAGQTMKGTASAAPYIPERMAHKLTFTGAVEAAYDGSSDVSVEIPEGGGTVTPEDIAAAVEAYMAEHPVEETDPTVPEWAKAATKPSYTAQEVGALSADTKIPVVPTKLSAFENDAGFVKSSDVEFPRCVSEIDVPGDGTIEVYYTDDSIVTFPLPTGGDANLEEIKDEIVKEVAEQLSYATIFPETKISEDSGVGTWDGVEATYSLNLPVPLTIGVMYKVTVDGVSHFAKAEEYNDGFYVENGVALFTDDLNIFYQEGGAAFDTRYNALIAVSSKYVGEPKPTGADALIPFTLQIDCEKNASVQIPTTLPNPHKLTFSGAVNAEYDGSEAVEVVIPQGGGGGEIDISRDPDLVLEVSEEVTELSISEINGAPINATEMVVLWEHPSGALYVPNYFRFNNEVMASTGVTALLANFNLPVSACPTESSPAAILARVKKINDGAYRYEFSGLQQTPGAVTGVYPQLFGAVYRNIFAGETSIKEFYVYQSAKVQKGCKVSVWVK